MAKSLDEIIAALPKERQEAIYEHAERLKAEEMTLRELRKARAQSQRKLAEKLKVGQAAISKIEKRADMYVSTLRSYIEAMGGELRIIAQFPNQPAIEIANLQDLVQNSELEETTLNSNSTEPQ